MYFIVNCYFWGHMGLEEINLVNIFPLNFKYSLLLVPFWMTVCWRAEIV